LFQKTERAQQSVGLFDIFKSFKVEFESIDLEAQVSEQCGSLASAMLKAECKDIERFFEEDTISFEVVIQKLSTALRCEGSDIYQPIAFELLGVHLAREYLGAKLTGSRFQWIPQIENAIVYLISASKSDVSKYAFHKIMLVLFMFIIQFRNKIVLSLQ